MPISLEQYAKLPKYVQNELHRLEADLRRAKRQLAEMESGDTNVRYGGYGDEHHLPRDSRVTFTVSGEDLAVGIVKYDTKEQLSIYTGDGYLDIRPQSSNVVTVVVRDRG